MSKRRIQNMWDLRFFRGNRERYEHAAFWEKAVVRLIISHIPEDMKEHIEYSFAPGAGSSEKLEESPFNSEHPWDIEFSYDGKVFAYVEVAERRKMAFDKYPTQFIQDYKVEVLPTIEQPVFFLYVFSETNEYYWTTREKAKICHPGICDRWVEELGEYQEQRNYEVPKDSWRPGIGSLVGEMLEEVRKL